MKAFEILRRGGKPSDPILKRPKADTRIVNRVSATKRRDRPGFEWKRRGQTGPSAWKRVGTRQKLEEVLGGARLKVGDALYVRRTGSRTVFVLRAVEYTRPTPIPSIPDPASTDGVKRLWVDLFEATAEAEREIGVELDVVYMGIYNCRKIAGSSTWSQHAFRNALDFRIRRSEAPLQSIDTAATSRVVSKIRARGHAAEVLWQISGHFFHAHLTASPKRFGTPECA